ncbi:FHA domain-containing protein [Agromyces sp. NPDC055520]
MVEGAVSSAAVVGAPAWDVIVGDRFIAAIAAPAPERVLSALADAAGDAALSLESLVGIVPAGRVDPVSSFGLVWWPDAGVTSVTAVVRGDAVVDLASPGGSRRFDARDIRPWHLADFDDVVALRITDAAAPLSRIDGAGPPVAPPRASLRASAVEWAAVGRPAVGQPAVGQPAVAGAPGVAIGEDVAAHVAARPEPWPDADTVLAVPERAGRTAPPPVAPARPPTTNGPRFRVGSGSPLTVTAPVLIGRRPLRPRVAAPGLQPELLTVSSPESIVSGTHLELRVVGSRLVATDLHSTNGTMVRSDSGDRRLRSGESVVVLPGTILDLGDDTIIEILSAQGAPRT